MIATYQMKIHECIWHLPELRLCGKQVRRTAELQFVVEEYNPFVTDCQTRRRDRESLSDC